MYILVYMYTYSRVTSICIDLSKIKLFVNSYSYSLRPHALPVPAVAHVYA